MSARWTDERATAVLDDAGAPLLWMLIVFLILGSIAIASGLL